MDKISIIKVFLQDQFTGRLTLTPEGLCAFEYDAAFLKSGISVSPFFLPLQSGLFIAKPQPFQGGFGVFNDSLPDGWGNLVLDRYLRKQGIDPHKLTIPDRLSLVGSTGRGALSYRPDRSIQGEDDFVGFDRLAAEAQKMLLSSDYTGEDLERLYRYGGSSGGARPKVFVKSGDQEWLVKFKVTTDPEDVGSIEYEYSLLAKTCSILMPETTLFEGKYFGVERYDRTFHGKIHTISAAGLLHADYRIPSLDYLDLFKACRILTADMEQVYALFRQMVFNIAISNRDDHAKNFSFQFREGKWQLSPAYDLLPSAGFNGYHTTTINGQGEPAFKDILSIASKIGLNPKRCKNICSEVIEKCRAEGKLKFIPA
ncbi:MAG: type II toxin-antitoxin system HipA family toxin [Mangrovibacterium sp.]